MIIERLFTTTIIKRTKKKKEKKRKHERKYVHRCVIPDSNCCYITFISLQTYHLMIDSCNLSTLWIICNYPGTLPKC